LAPQEFGGFEREQLRWGENLLFKAQRGEEGSYRLYLVLED